MVFIKLERRKNMNPTLHYAIFCERAGNSKVEGEEKTSIIEPITMLHFSSLPARKSFTIFLGMSIFEKKDYD